MSDIIFARVKTRHDTESAWLLENPVLLEGEIALVTDLKKYKVGDGSSNFADLEYWDVASGSVDWDDIANKPDFASVATSGDYNDLSNTPAIPTNTSELTNDSGFITAGDIPTIPTKTSDLTNDSGFVTSSDIPTKTSDLTNDSGFITAGDIPEIPTKTSDLTNDSGFITLSDIPEIPTKTSDLANDSGFITEEDLPDPYVLPAATTTTLGGIKVGTGLSVSSDGTLAVNGSGQSVDWNDIENKPTFASVATSGDYDDLSNTPTIPTSTSDLTNDSGFITLSDIPTIPTKTSDLTNDSGFITLSDIPEIPTVNNPTVTINQGGQTKGSFTLNQSQNATINLDSSSSQIVNITWSQLKSLRDNNGLTPGMQYRITDYVTTTITENTMSAGHVFDIIVMADDVDKLNENARAIQHAGDTYFSNSNLSAWELKYCLDNDTNRFVWADTTNGKGVIYYMKDEFNNEVHYDFKNIRFMVGAKSNAGTVANVYYYTFSVATGTNDSNVTDHSRNGGYCRGNSFKEYKWQNQMQLNFIVCRNKSYSSECWGNSTGINCRNITCGDKCWGWSCGDTCLRLSCGDECDSWSCGNRCSDLTCGRDCHNWSCGNWCYDMTCGNGCYRWSCGNQCNEWSCGDYCNNWSCGDGCIHWKFGSKNAIKSYYRNIIIDGGCSYFYIDTNQSTSSSNYVQNIHICQGILGTSSYKTITVTTTNNDYQIEYKAANSVTNII